MDLSSTTQPAIGVIGAGCSGLTAIKMLSEAGLDNIVCFEKGRSLGGNWAYSPDESHSSVTETTHLISSKTMSQFSDFPMPADYPDYPSHRQVLAYFEAYAWHFDLEKYIRYNTEVVSADKLPGEKWQLRLSDGSSPIFDYLLVANGHHSVPRHPAWRAHFAGKYLHSHSFKNTRGLEGQRVLVVGAGNSGCDCAVESSRVAACVDLSVRSAQYIVPKFMMGRPTDTFAARMKWLPRGLQNLLHRLSLRLTVGDYRDYGLPRPNFPVTQAHPTVNNELLDRIRHGKITPRPGVQKVEDQTVFFTDGTRQTYDVIVAATGYKTAFPFIDKNLLDWEDATNIPLYLRVFHPDHPSLFFIGLVQPQGSVWPLSEAQARLVARLLNGQWRLPTDWRERAIQEGRSIEKSFIANPRHAVEVHFLPYLHRLEKLARS